MKVKPVTSIPKPDYPDKYAPETKKASAAAVPKRWRNAPLAVSLSAAVALGLSGCALYGIDGGGPSPAYPAGSETGEVIPGISNLFIPLFEFGEGTGSIGCVSVAAPSFMSEEEAFAVLASAFEDAGLALSETPDMLEGANVPIVKNKFESNSKESFYEDAVERDLSVRNMTVVQQPDSETVVTLPVKFVSRKDIEEWGREVNFSSSVETYNMKSAARGLAEKNAYLAVFYDPVTFIREGEGIENMRYTTQEEAESLLREQADAFAEWLKSEGLTGD